MRTVMHGILRRVNDFRAGVKARGLQDPVDHCLARIKTDASIREKCVRRGLAPTTANALFEIKDAIGVRIVCPFLNDVYLLRKYLVGIDDYEIVLEKDYIRHAKPNGYRSFHMILREKSGYYAEIQIRTVSMDSWAALEHQLRYKKNPGVNDALIASELKRCADELASTDVSMQTIRDMIRGDSI
ncbi:MAG: GTP pyrophosphokinase family protein [Lachnospiraceae bacterium]|nr:GTP pyrophosphokinase family protein [Lachnospiraceae bacterium]